MKKFRKKPIVIHAVQIPLVDGGVDPFYNLVSAGIVKRSGDQYYISTLEGDMRANPGDWVIRGVQGEYYSCKPDIFAATYEAV